jgi:protein-S-isoprenylcysteine O-methyltransferase Ste14
MEAEVRRGIISWIATALFGLVLFALLIFLLAGRWDWVWGWVFIGLMATASVANVLILLPTNPELLAERSRGIRRNTKGWDRIVASLAAGLLPMTSWAVAALDERYHWPPAMSPALQSLGAVVFACGWALFLWATASNAFFSVTVRIQEERQHTVQTGGPYQLVRHPGYVGAMVYQLATPFLLGSWWALIPSLLSLVFFVLRTALEDRTLYQELEGYDEYARQTRYRLLPGVW